MKLSLKLAFSLVAVIFAIPTFAAHAGEQRGGGSNVAGIGQLYFALVGGAHWVEAFASAGPVDVDYVPGVYAAAGGSTVTRTVRSSTPTIRAAAWSGLSWAPIPGGGILATAEGSWAQVNPPTTPIGRARAYWDVADPQLFQSLGSSTNVFSGEVSLTAGFRMQALGTADVSYSLSLGVDQPGFDFLCQVNARLTGSTPLELRIHTNPFFGVSDSQLEAMVRGALRYDSSDNSYTLDEELPLLSYAIQLDHPGQQVVLTFDQHGEANLVGAVPEPTTLAALGTSLLALRLRRRRSRS
ncbi:MAG TPA: PEP-CTERM sorting domain-containing protein [Fimbriimonadaceae bacterium]|nr:PEP-CTERM sorting domain-containing protein [Fimbriimonadaceae bacterium]HRJ97092.1 PEP-CTERM sorting domain-containing protein [Fimbriimonadaceae bacterium]